MQITFHELPYRSQNTVFSPEQDAEGVLHLIIAHSKQPSSKYLRVLLCDSYKRDVFFNATIENIKLLVADNNVQQELDHFEVIEICGRNPEEVSEIVWSGTRRRPIN